MAGASQPITLEIENAAEVKAAFQELAARLNDLTPVFRDIGEAMLNSTRARFETSTDPEGHAWKDLSPATLHARAMARGGTVRSGKNKGRYTKKAAMAYAFAKPLIDTGNLMNLLNYQPAPMEVRIGTPLIYGAAHQFGRPEINLPARPFLGVSAADEQELLDILNEYLAGAL